MPGVPRRNKRHGNVKKYRKWEDPVFVAKYKAHRKVKTRMAKISRSRNRK